MGLPHIFFIKNILTVNKTRHIYFMA